MSAMKQWQYEQLERTLQKAIPANEVLWMGPEHSQRRKEEIAEINQALEWVREEIEIIKLIKQME